MLIYIFISRLIQRYRGKARGQKIFRKQVCNIQDFNAKNRFKIVEYHGDKLKYQNARKIKLCARTFLILISI